MSTHSIKPKYITGYCSDTESYDHSYQNSDDLYRFSENEMKSSRKSNTIRYNNSNVNLLLFFKSILFEMFFTL